MMAERTMAIVISTSRRPAQKVRTFCKELARALPQTTHMVRGSSSFRELAHNAFSTGASRLFVVYSRENNPNSVKIYRLEPGCLEEIFSIQIAENQLKRERNATSRVRKPSSIAFEFHNVSDWLQKKFLDSFAPILASSNASSGRMYTFSVSAEDNVALKTYTGVIIDPLNDTIVSPSFRFFVDRRNVNERP
ncbi:MAG: hypothetical protein ACXAB4_13260 [Candidatus Hodarchaeales archaeon]|jgi:rRNA maturation protein Rpf1